MTSEPLQRADDVTYRFRDRDMDFMFQWAAGAAKTGGLDAGELFHVGSRIEDGDAASWVREFEAYADMQVRFAADREERGQRRSAGEALMKAYACYRQAWQFVGRGPRTPIAR